ncbi:MAG: membrane integrity-associated transporter subunit PqiC [Bryobacterales bacterium]|nr:membrane integrity-associated transporter subunit PqiC [Bryobacterales bacterium]
MRRRNQTVGIVLPLMLLSLAGCAGKVQYPSYYVLDVPVPPSSKVEKPVFASIAVREFRAPSFLKEGPIVYRPTPEQIDFYDYHRWAEDPRRVVTRAMVQEIRARGLAESVELFDGRGTPECLITGTVDHLEEVDKGANVSIEVGLSARMINVRTGELLWQDTTTKTATLDKRSVAGVVSEMSQELGSAVNSLVSSIEDHRSTVSLSLGSSNSE